MGSTQPLTEVSTSDFLGDKGLTTLPPSRADCLEILGASDSRTRLGLSRTVQGKLYLYLCQVRYGIEKKVSSVPGYLRVGKGSLPVSR